MENTPGADDIYDTEFIKSVFDKCSSKYIWFSYICSFGFTERWRKQCVSKLKGLPENAMGYDLMAGTGEAWPHLLKHHPTIEKITAIDLSSGMHKYAMSRLHNMRAHKIDFIEDDIFNSALPDESADFIVSTFGLKTFSADDHKHLAALVATKLKPGGQFSFVEASDPKGWMLRPIYNFHMKRVLPIVEKLFLSGAQDFTMIGQYTDKFQNASGFAKAMRDEGLNVNFHKFMFGCATGVSGSRGAKSPV